MPSRTIHGECDSVSCLIVPPVARSSFHLWKYKGNHERQGALFQTLQRKRQRHREHTQDIQLDSQGNDQCGGSPGQVEVEALRPQRADEGPSPHPHPNLFHVIKVLRCLSWFPETVSCFRWKWGLRQPARKTERPRTSPLPRVFLGKRGTWATLGRTGPRAPGEKLELVSNHRLQTSRHIKTHPVR